jgi:hypothetical protein
VGDIGGTRIDNGPVLPQTPPPDVNVEFCRQSIKKIQELNPEIIYPTHFGKSAAVKEHLDELEDRLLQFTEWIGTRLEEGKNEEDIVPEFENLLYSILKEAKVSPELIKVYELADPFWMNVWGLARYWKKFRLTS